ncbi:hypothetical protein [Phormidium sp. CCY1219]|uniref:hypothetical protein n=1 Tax=Phormidium sp. CCY1219 TaxID=2886104 RepID=UPI002D1F1D34|nr:hypothetical protein [Phormidium sp. CCY1219]MEB3828279.1 hypothetical protein [Phormidium sp. CCY1219]
MCNITFSSDKILTQKSGYSGMAIRHLFGTIRRDFGEIVAAIWEKPRFVKNAFLSLHSGEIERADLGREA